MRAKLLEAGEHDGERLVGAPLAQLQAAHGVAIRGVAGEMEAAEALDGQDLAGAQQIGGLTDGRRRAGFAAGGQLDHAVSLRIQTQQPHAGAAHRTRVGLRVEAAVARVLVLPPAGRAQREAPHRRPLAVVGQVLDDREPGPAVGAVGERVVVAAVAGVEQLATAVVAGGDVRRDELVGAGVGLALEDDERVPGRRPVRRDARLHLPHLIGGDVAARRRLGRQRLGKAGHRVGRALSEHLDAGRRVEHPAAQPVPGGE